MNISAQFELQHDKKQAEYNAIEDELASIEDDLWVIQSKRDELKQEEKRLNELLTEYEKMIETVTDIECPGCNSSTIRIIREGTAGYHCRCQNCGLYFDTTFPPGMTLSINWRSVLAPIITPGQIRLFANSQQARGATR